MWEIWKSGRDSEELMATSDTLDGAIKLAENDRGRLLIILDPQERVHSLYRDGLVVLG